MYGTGCRYRIGTGGKENKICIEAARTYIAVTKAGGASGGSILSKSNEARSRITTTSYRSPRPIFRSFARCRLCIAWSLVTVGKLPHPDSVSQPPSGHECRRAVNQRVKKRGFFCLIHTASVVMDACVSAASLTNIRTTFPSARCTAVTTNIASSPPASYLSTPVLVSPN